MAQKGRHTLKSFFKKGTLPREGQFADLIDSMLNKVDDGISSSIEDGLKITPLDHGGRLISFYDGVELEHPKWSIALDNDQNILSVNDEYGNRIITFNDQANIGVGTDTPHTKLDVAGIVSMKGRRGSFTGDASDGGSVVVPADGKWHPIIQHLNGCRAFEIVAGAGLKKSGTYTLMHATAMNCFNGRGRKIKTIHATYRWFWQRLALRWTGGMNDYNLEVKTWMNYGSSAMITCEISSLWHDPFMNIGNDGNNLIHKQ